jgi:hypothetical protein
MPLDYVPFDVLYLNDIFTKLNLKSTDVLNYIHYQFCNYIHTKGKNVGLMCCRKSINPIIDNCCSQHIKYKKKVENIKTEEINFHYNKYYKKKENIYYCNKKGVKNSKCRRRVKEKGDACIYHKNQDTVKNKYDIEYLRNISIFYIMEYLGYNFTNDGSSRKYKDDKLNLVVNIKNQFYDNVSNISGGGAIDLLIKLFKYTFKNTIIFLKTILDNKNYNKIIILDNLNNMSKVDINIDVKRKEYKDIPIYNLDNIEKVKKYLINKRKINKDIVEDLIKNKLLYSDRHSNCVFVDHTKKYSYIRSTNTVKYVITNGKPTFFKYKFGNSNDIYLFESIIDALSFRTLYNKNGNYIVTNGNTLINKLNQLPELKSADAIYLCFDNDAQGHKFDNISKRSIDNNNIMLLKSIKKDFNKDLTESKF